MPAAHEGRGTAMLKIGMNEKLTCIRAPWRALIERRPKSPSRRITRYVGHRGVVSRFRVLRLFLLVCQSLSRGSVNLHGLSVPEALGKVEQEFQSAAQRGDTVFRFIVGMHF